MSSTAAALAPSECQADPKQVQSLVDQISQAFQRGDRHFVVEKTTAYATQVGANRVYTVNGALQEAVVASFAAAGWSNPRWAQERHLSRYLRLTFLAEDPVPNVVPLATHN